MSVTRADKRIESSFSFYFANILNIEHIYIHFNKYYKHTIHCLHVRNKEFNKILIDKVKERISWHNEVYRKWLLSMCMFKRLTVYKDICV
jgi:hypothetical protein